MEGPSITPELGRQMEGPCTLGTASLVKSVSTRLTLQSNLERTREGNKMADYVMKRKKVVTINSLSLRCKLYFFSFPLSFLFMERCSFVQHLNAWCPQRPEKGVRFPGTKVPDSCAL